MQNRWVNNELGHVYTKEHCSAMRKLAVYWKFDWAKIIFMLSEVSQKENAKTYVLFISVTDKGKQRIY